MFYVGFGVGKWSKMWGWWDSGMDGLSRHNQTQTLMPDQWGLVILIKCVATTGASVLHEIRYRREALSAFDVLVHSIGEVAQKCRE